MPKIISEQRKKACVKEFLAGSSAGDVCAKHHVSKSSLYRWVKLFDSHPGRVTGKMISGHRLQCLEEKVKKLQQENDILKAASCSREAPLDEKLKAVEKLRGQYSLHAICDALGVSRGTFYNRKRSETTVKQIDVQDEMFKPIIRDIFVKSKGRLGSKPIRAKMHDMGYEIGAKRVHRLMEEMGLQAQVAKPNWAYLHPNAYYYRNKLNRRFTQTAPDKVWVSDVTYVPVANRFCFVCVVIDLFSRFVISYGVSGSNDTNLVMDTFCKAWEQREQPSGLMFHSDQGCQYTAYAFRQFLKDHHVDQSFSKPATPLDNAVAETFFSAFKKEEVFRHRYMSEEELDASVSEYIEFFNYDRPHRSLKMKTPAEFERLYAAAEELF